MKNEIVKKRCAIYTRKSTDDGLDQEFNSLDAQREAAEHHILSMAHEGWKILPEQYNDGGFSGGSMERPGLQKLMHDIEEGLIDIVVVYKIDRLSRSMADFMKMVALFEKYNVSFVSVTQHFNTETSMGRLILNILQSFAQFEREVTAERIRDKFAASKRKGMWMGGSPPLGYDVRDRKLIVNPEEAKIVQYIFNRFVETGSTTFLTKEMEKKGYTTKSWTSQKGRHHKGQNFSKFVLYKFLRNPIYIGKIRHKDKVYEGEHEGIIDPKIWDRVQVMINNRAERGVRLPHTETPALLRGLLVDADGYAMCSAAARRKNKTYRYYVSTQAVKKSYDHCPLKTVSAHLLEEIVVDQVRRLLSRPEWAARIAANSKRQDMAERDIMRALSNFDGLWGELFPKEQARILNLLIERITVHIDKIQIKFRPLGMISLLQEIMPDVRQKDFKTDTDSPIITEVPIRLKRYGGRKYITAPDGRDIVSALAPRFDPSMIRAIVRGHEMLEIMDKDPDATTKAIAKEQKIDAAYVAKYVRMTQLAPDIIEAIVKGRQPQTLTLSQMLRPFPDLWQDQRKHFGFGIIS